MSRNATTIRTQGQFTPAPQLVPKAKAKATATDKSVRPTLLRHAQRHQVVAAIVEQAEHSDAGGLAVVSDERRRRSNRA